MPAYLLGHAGGLMLEIRRAARQFRFVALLVAAHAAAAAFVVAQSGLPTNVAMLESGLDLSAWVFVPFLLFFVVWRAVRLIAVERPPRPLTRLVEDLALIVGDRRRLAEGLVVTLIYLVLMASFAQIKHHVPLVAPFAWDKTFFELDHLLFLGHDPWRLLWPLLGSAEATFLINLCYNLWLFVVYFWMLAAAFSVSDRERKLAFLFGFALIWIIGGNVLAIAFSSAGPVYYERLGLGTAYVELMDGLAASDRIYPVWALGVQETLWNSYAHGMAGPSGISAMPSMHNASTVFLAACARTVHPLLGRIMAGFAVVILLGSIHLGWHYAVDGILGAAIGVAGWWIGRALARASIRATQRNAER